jgi:2-(1,2-epoxy-1,2-dihydrophenyl)acetyl-CoA isomerase
MSMGIVSRVVPEETLAQEALNLAVQLASGPAHALGRTRALLRSSCGAGFDAHLDREAETIVQMAETAATGALIDTFVAAAR